MNADETSGIMMFYPLSTEWQAVVDGNCPWNQL